MRLCKLLAEAGLSANTVADDMEITGICSHAGSAAAGFLFVALRGLKSDGACFAAEAAARGAVFGVAERPLAGLPTLVVPDARAALAKLWDAWYGHPADKMTLVGITGTNGKTSTAFMLAAILRRAGHCTAVIGTVSTDAAGDPLVLPAEDPLANMTTPDPAQLYAHLARLRDAGVTHAVMEVTSHALFFRKVAPLRFARAVFTNLTSEHLDLHGDMTSYFAAKRVLFAQSSQGIVSLFCPYGQMLADSLDIPFLTVGRGNVTEVRADGAQGVGFTLNTDGGALPLTLPVPGDFSVENAALAAMTALSLGVSGADVACALAGFAGVPGRMERVAENPLDISVFIDYAHTPDALEKLLLSVRRFRRVSQRVILVFGCGGDRDRSKRAKMGQIATRLSDLTVVTSDNPRGESPAAIIAEIVRGMNKEKAYTIITDRAAAIAYAIDAAESGDIVLLAGKGHERYEIRGNMRLPFDERAIAEACMRQKLAGGRA